MHPVQRYPGVCTRRLQTEQSEATTTTGGSLGRRSGGSGSTNQFVTRLTGFTHPFFLVVLLLVKCIYTLDLYTYTVSVIYK